MGMKRRKLAATLSLLAIALLLVTGIPSPLSATSREDGSREITFTILPDVPDAGYYQTDLGMHGTAWRAERPANFAEKRPVVRGTRFRAKAAGQEWGHLPVPLIAKMGVPRLISMIQFTAKPSNGALSKPVRIDLWANTTRFDSANIPWPADNNTRGVALTFNPPIWREALGVSVLLEFANSTDTIALFDVLVRTVDADGPATDTDVVMQGTGWRPEVPGNLYPVQTFGWGSRVQRRLAGQDWVHMPLPLLTRRGVNPLYISLVQFCAQSSNGMSTRPIRVDLWGNDTSFASQAISWPADNGYHCVDVLLNPPVWQQSLGMSVLVSFANGTDTITLNKAWVRLKSTGTSSLDQPLGPEAFGQTHSVTQGTLWQAQTPLLLSRFRAFGWGVEAQKKVAGQTWVHIPVGLLSQIENMPYRISTVEFCARSTNGAATKPVRLDLWSGSSRFHTQAITWPADNGYHCTTAAPNSWTSRQSLGVSVQLSFANSTDRITLYKAWAEVVQ